MALEGTERRRQRPGDAATQHEHSSGKKKTHTDKDLLLVNEMAGTVEWSISGRPCPAKKHDKKATDEAQTAYPLRATLDKDTGFQGYEPPGVLTQQPQKNHKRGKEWRRKFLNHLISRVLVIVENVIARVKRCRMVKDVLCLTAEGLSDLVIEIPAAYTTSGSIVVTRSLIRCAKPDQLRLNPLMSIH